MRIEIAGNQFELLSQKGMWWHEKKTLLLSDLHLGKITHFRKAGIAVPSAATERNFIVLHHLVQLFQPVRIIILGDLFHNRYNKEWDQFVEWRQQYEEIEMIVVAGNHDILPVQMFKDAGITYTELFTENAFTFTHHPEEMLDTESFVFCGHIHPVFCLRSGARQHIRLPCFVQDRAQMILPSFGVFTGGYEMDRKAGRDIFVIAEDKVLKV
jgi:DNA ligase-associated metallophosphoesterase